MRLWRAKEGQMQVILKTASLIFMVLYLGALGYLISHCYGENYDGPIWEWQIIGLDYWETLSTFESCISQEVHEVGGEGSTRVFWNGPMFGIGLWMLGHLVGMRPYARADKDEVREKARRRL